MRKIILICLLLLVGTAGFAQSTIDTAAYKHTLQYLQGDGVYENGMMVFLTGLKNSIWSHFSMFIGDAQAHRFVGEGSFPWHAHRRATLAEVRQIGDVVLLRYPLSPRFTPG